MQFIGVLAVLLLWVSPIAGQECRARYNQSIVGRCSSISSCQGTILAGSACQQQKCCVPELMVTAPSCLDASEFDSFYNYSTRTIYLRSVLNRALSSAGICGNCQAKAAFLAIAATMTNNFETDESPQTDAQLAADDGKYGNVQQGDGARYRRRGLFGVRGRTMYQRLQELLPQYQSLSNPESVAIVENAGVIAAQLWNRPDLLLATSLTNSADGTFYGFSIIWLDDVGRSRRIAHSLLLGID